MPTSELDQIRRTKLRLARTSSKTLFSFRALKPTHFCQEMVGDLRTWDDDYVDELCDIVFGEFLVGNFAQGVPRDPVWDVIT
ncbi:hypothetical protein ACB092_01G338500 [Castanea dentata]